MDFSYPDHFLKRWTFNYLKVIDYQIAREWVTANQDKIQSTITISSYRSVDKYGDKVAVEITHARNDTYDIKFARITGPITCFQMKVKKK